MTVVVPALDAWYSQSTLDGGAHYGHLSRNGEVNAVCGERFKPLVWTDSGRVLGHRHPSDAAHACRRCLWLSGYNNGDSDR